jgi:hypothetical protein
MVKDMGDGYFKEEGTAGPGEYYGSRAAYDARHGSAGNASLNGQLGLFAIPLIAGAILGVVIAIIMGFQLEVYIFKTFPLFILSGAAAIVVLIVVRKIIPIRFLRMLLALAAAVAVGYFGIKASLGYYKNSDIVQPSLYSADFIQALPDGSAPLLYSKRFKKGDAPAALTVGEKVRIAGVTLDEAEYRVTTLDGKTGWIDAAALPEEDIDTRGSALEVTGVRALSGQHDREADLLKQRYDGSEPDKSFKLKDEVLKRAVPIGVKTPWLALREKDYAKGETLSPQPVELNLASVTYNADCTILLFTIAGKGLTFNLDNNDNAAGWNESLTVKDLDTGETWPVFPRGYEQNHAFHHGGPSGNSESWYPYEIKGEEFISNLVIFFPPFKSRHFSLTHEVPALPKKPGKIAALLKGFSSQDDYYTDWDFPEVRVR